MRKGVAVSTIVLSAALALTGCMTKQGDVGNKNIRPNALQAQNWQGTNGSRFANDQANERNRIYGTQQMNNNVVGRHGNTKLELSQKIADKLAALPEIKSAQVALTDKNAYVAIVEDKKGTMPYNRSAGRQKTGMGTMSTTHTSRIHSSSIEVSEMLKNKVADLVKGMTPSVQNVYVSANPDLYGRMQSLGDEISKGRPIQGFITEFNALVERVFPQAAGTRP